MQFLILKERLNKIHPLSEALWERMLSILYQRHYDKDVSWLKEDYAGYMVGFIVSGGAKSIIREESGKKADKLWLADSMIISSSLFTGKGSNRSIEFTANSDVFQFSIRALESLQEDHRDDILPYINHFLGEAFLAHEERISWLSNKDGEHRYKEAVQIYGNHFYELTNSEQAFFIGVAGRTLNNICARLAKSKDWKSSDYL